MLYGVIALVSLAMLVYCVLDIIRTPDAQVRNLPKLLWLLLVVILPLPGGVAWLMAGRPVPGGAGGGPYTGSTGAAPRAPRPGPVRPSNPDDDEDFLRSLRDRAEQQRRAAEDQRRREAEGS